jgi:hypothetical protein
VSTPDAASLIPGAVLVSANQLRGYPAGALAGTGYVSGNVELRFPIADPARGRSTWPIFLQRIHGALFMDAGDAFDRPGQPIIAGHRLAAEELRFSAGAELRVEVALLYFLRTDVRLGIARPLGALLDSGRAADAANGLVLPEVAWYLTFGSSF